MSEPVLLILFDFSMASYTRIYCFQKCFNRKFLFYGPIYVQCQKEVDLTSNSSAKLGFFDVVPSSAYHIRLPYGFLHKNL